MKKKEKEKKKKVDVGMREYRQREKHGIVKNASVSNEKKLCKTEEETKICRYSNACGNFVL